MDMSIAAVLCDLTPTCPDRDLSDDKKDVKLTKQPHTYNDASVQIDFFSTVTWQIARRWSCFYALSYVFFVVAWFKVRKTLYLCQLFLPCCSQRWGRWTHSCRRAINANWKLWMDWVNVSYAIYVTIAPLFEQLTVLARSAFCELIWRIAVCSVTRLAAQSSNESLRRD